MLGYSLFIHFLKDNKTLYKQEFMNTAARKIVSVTTLLCFLLTQNLFASPGMGIEILSNREAPSFLQIDIPAELATLDGLYEAPLRSDPKLILHIQNAHANYGAQQKISKLLQHLEKQYAIKTIFVEGASEDLNPDYLKMFSDRERNLKLADFLAQQGELTGAELYLLEQNTDGGGRREDGASSFSPSAMRHPQSSPAARAVGIEDAALYRENYEALKKVFAAETTVKRYLDGLEGRLSTLGSKVFSKDLLRLTGEWKKFEKGHREFMPYVRSLAAESKRVLDIDLESLLSQIEWPQITRLLVLQAMEKELDTTKGLAERGALIRFLKEKRVSAELVSAIENFQDQRVTVLRATNGAATQLRPRDLMEQLVTEAGPKGFRFYDYPNFSLYAGYLILKSELDPKGLFGEIQKLFAKILDQLAQAPEQKRLLGLYRRAELVRKLLNLELTRKDWQGVLAQKDLLAMDALVAELKAIGTAVGRETGTPQTKFETETVKPEFSTEIMSVQDAAYGFYEAARKREDVFYEKIASVMQKDSLNKAVVITGGFHTDGITELLREHEISYGVLTPRLSENSDENLYRNMMMQSKPRLFEVSNLENASLATSLKTLGNQGMIPEDVVASMLDAALQASGRSEVREILSDVNASPFAQLNGIQFEDTKKTNPQGLPIIKLATSEAVRQVRSEMRTNAEIQADILKWDGYRNGARARAVRMLEINRELMRLFAERDIVRKEQEEGAAERARMFLDKSRDYALNFKTFAERIRPEGKEEAFPGEIALYQEIDQLAQAATPEEAGQALKEKSQVLSEKIKELRVQFPALQAEGNKEALDRLNREVTAYYKARLKTQLLQTRAYFLQKDLNQGVLLTMLMALALNYTKLSREYSWQRRRAIEEAAARKIQVVSRAGKLNHVYDYENFRITVGENKTPVEVKQSAWLKKESPDGAVQYVPGVVTLKFDDLDEAFRSQIHTLMRQEQDYAVVLSHALDLDYWIDILKSAPEMAVTQEDQILMEKDLRRILAWLKPGRVSEKVKAREEIKTALTTLRKQEGKYLESVQSSLEMAKTALKDQRLPDIERIKRAVESRADGFANMLRLSETNRAAFELKESAEAGAFAEGEQLLDLLYRTHYLHPVSRAEHYSRLQNLVFRLKGNFSRLAKPGATPELKGFTLNQITQDLRTVQDITQKRSEVRENIAQRATRNAQREDETLSLPTEQAGVDRDTLRATDGGRRSEVRESLESGIKALYPGATVRKLRFGVGDFRLLQGADEDYFVGILHGIDYYFSLKTGKVTAHDPDGQVVNRLDLKAVKVLQDLLRNDLTEGNLYFGESAVTPEALAALELAPQDLIEYDLDELVKRDPADLSEQARFLSSLWNGEITELDFRELERNLKRGRIQINDIAEWCSYLLPRSGRRSGIQYAMREILKNAFVHGNKMDLTLPVFMRFDKASGSFEVLDTAEPRPLRQQMTSDWAGTQGGVEKLEQYGRYVRETVRGMTRVTFTPYPAEDVSVRAEARQENEEGMADGGWRKADETPSTILPPLSRPAAKAGAEDLPVIDEKTAPEDFFGRPQWRAHSWNEIGPLLIAAAKNGSLTHLYVDIDNTLTSPQGFHNTVKQIDQMNEALPAVINRIAEEERRMAKHRFYRLVHGLEAELLRDLRSHHGVRVVALTARPPDAQPRTLAMLASVGLADEAINDEFYYLDYTFSDQDTVFDKILFAGDPQRKAGMLEKDFQKNKKGSVPGRVVYVDDLIANTEVIRRSFPAATIHLDLLDANNLMITRAEYIRAAEEAAREENEEHVFENLINAFDQSVNEAEEEDVRELARDLLSPDLELSFLGWTDMTTEFLKQHEIPRDALRVPNGNGKRSEMRLFNPPVYARGGVYDMFLGGDLSLLENTHSDILEVLKRLKKDSEGLLIGPGFGYEILDLQKEFPEFRFRSVGERDFFGHKDLRANIEKRYGLAPAEAQSRIEELKKNFLKADLKKTSLEKLYGPGRFDFVILGNGVMVYLPNKVRLIEDMYRVLKPGGAGFADGGGLVVLDEKDDLEAWRATQSEERDPAKTAAILNRVKGLEVKNQPLGIGSDRLLTGMTFTKTAEPLELPLKLIEVNKNKAGRYQEVYRYVPIVRSEARSAASWEIPLSTSEVYEGATSEVVERFGKEKLFPSVRTRQLFAGAGAMSWLNLTDHIQAVFVPRAQISPEMSVDPVRSGEGPDAVYAYRLPEDLTVAEALQWIGSVRKLPFSNGQEVLSVLAASFTKLAAWMARKALLQAEISTTIQTMISGVWAIGAALTHETLRGGTIPSIQAMAAGQPSPAVLEKEVFDWLGLTPKQADRFRKVFDGKADDIFDVILKKVLQIAAESVLLEVKALAYFRGSRLKKILAEQKGGRMRGVLREARKILRDAKQAPARLKLKAEKDVIAMIAERISKFPGWVRTGKEQTVLESSPTSEAINCVQRTALMAMYLEDLRKEGLFRKMKVFSVLSENHISLAVEFGNEKYLVDPSLRGSGEARFKFVDEYPPNVSVGPLKEGILFAYLCNVGEYLAEEGEYEGAVDAYRRAIRIYPSEGYAYRDLGTYLYLQGKYAEATIMFRDAIALIPEDPLTRTLWGLSLYAEGRIKEAVEAYWAGKEKPSHRARVHAAFGKILFDHDLFGRAIDAYQKGLELAPEDATIHHSLGNAYEKMEMLDQAVSSYREAVRISPAYAKAYRDLGRTLFSQGARSSGPRQLRLLEEALGALTTASGIYKGLEETTHKILAGLYEYWATLYPPDSALAMKYENKAVKHLQEARSLEAEHGLSLARSEVRGLSELRKTDETSSSVLLPFSRLRQVAGKWLTLGAALLGLSIPQAWMAAWLGKQGSFKVNAREYSLKVITGEERIKQAVRSGSAVYVAPTGPFKEVEIDGEKIKQPIGWIREGVEENAFIPTTRSNSAMLKGVFLADRDGRSRIVPAADFDPEKFPAARYPTSFQAGPMAIEKSVINFRIGKQHSGFFKGRKVVVGVDGAGNVHVLDRYGFDVAGITGPTTEALRRALLKWRDENNIQDALFVDGGSTGLKVFQTTPAAALMALPRRSEVRKEVLPTFQTREDGVSYGTLVLPLEVTEEFRRKVMEPIAQKLAEKKGQGPQILLIQGDEKARIGQVLKDERIAGYDASGITLMDADVYLEKSGGRVTNFDLITFKAELEKALKRDQLVVVSGKQVYIYWAGSNLKTPVTKVLMSDSPATSQDGKNYDLVLDSILPRNIRSEIRAESGEIQERVSLYVLTESDFENRTELLSDYSALKYRSPEAVKRFAGELAAMFKETYPGIERSGDWVLVSAQVRPYWPPISYVVKEVAALLGIPYAVYRTKEWRSAKPGYSSYTSAQKRTEEVSDEVLVPYEGEATGLLGKNVVFLDDARNTGVMSGHYMKQLKELGPQKLLSAFILDLNLENPANEARINEWLLEQKNYTAVASIVDQTFASEDGHAQRGLLSRLLRQPQDVFEVISNLLQPQTLKELLRWAEETGKESSYPDHVKFLRQRVNEVSVDPRSGMHLSPVASSTSRDSLEARSEMRPGEAELAPGIMAIDQHQKMLDRLREHVRQTGKALPVLLDFDARTDVPFYAGIFPYGHWGTKALQEGLVDIFAHIAPGDRLIGAAKPRVWTLRKVWWWFKPVIVEVKGKELERLVAQISWSEAFLTAEHLAKTAEAAKGTGSAGRTKDKFEGSDPRAESTIKEAFRMKPQVAYYPGGLDLSIFEFFPNLKTAHYFNQWPFRVPFDKDKLVDALSGELKAFPGLPVFGKMMLLYLFYAKTRPYFFTEFQQKIFHPTVLKEPQIGVEPFMVADLKRVGATRITVTDLRDRVYEIRFSDAGGKDRRIIYHEEKIDPKTDMKTIDPSDEKADLLYVKAFEDLYDVAFHKSLLNGLNPGALLASDFEESKILRQVPGLIGPKPLGVLRFTDKERTGYANELTVYPLTLPQINARSDPPRQGEDGSVPRIARAEMREVTVNDEFRQKVIELIGKLLKEKKKEDQEHQILTLQGLPANGKTEIGKLLKNEGIGGYAPEAITFLDTDDYFRRYAYAADRILTEDLEKILKKGQLVIIAGLYIRDFLKEVGYGDVSVNVLLDAPPEKVRLQALFRDNQISNLLGIYNAFGYLRNESYDLVLKDIPPYTPSLNATESIPFSFASPAIYGSKVREQSYRVSKEDINRIGDLLYREGKRSGLRADVDFVRGKLSDVELLADGVHRVLSSLKHQGDEPQIMTVRSYEKGLEVVFEGQEDPAWDVVSLNLLGGRGKDIPEWLVANSKGWSVKVMREAAPDLSPLPKGRFLIALGMFLADPSELEKANVFHGSFAADARSETRAVPKRQATNTEEILKTLAWDVREAAKNIRLGTNLDDVKRSELRGMPAPVIVTGVACNFWGPQAAFGSMAKIAADLVSLIVKTPEALAIEQLNGKPDSILPVGQLPGLAMDVLNGLPSKDKWEAIEGVLSSSEDQHYGLILFTEPDKVFTDRVRAMSPGTRGRFHYKRVDPKDENLEWILRDRAEDIFKNVLTGQHVKSFATARERFVITGTQAVCQMLMKSEGLGAAVVERADDIGPKVLDTAGTVVAAILSQELLQGDTLSEKTSQAIQKEGRLYRFSPSGLQALLLQVIADIQGLQRLLSAA